MEKIKKYNKYFEEQQELSYDPRVTKILKILKKESFGSELQRKRFIHYLTMLHNLKDPRIRKVFKMLGDYCTDALETIIELQNEVKNAS